MVNKMMKDAFEKVTGERPNFTDSRKRKSKKSKKSKKVIDKLSENDIIQDNDEGFAVSGRYPKTLDYLDIEKPKYTGMRWDKPILEWNTADVFFYVVYLYREKYNEELLLQRVPAQIDINRARSVLEEAFGTFHWLMMKDYIIFFFENYIDFLRGQDKEGNFYFSHLLNKAAIRSFKSKYDLSKSCEEYNKVEEKEKKEIKKPRNTDLEKSFILGDSSLVSNFGIVLSTNWLIKVKMMKQEEAIEMVKSGCRKMLRRNALFSVVESTEKFSPYPSWLPFKDVEGILGSIIPDIKVSIEFRDTDENTIKFYERLKNR